MTEKESVFKKVGKKVDKFLKEKAAKSGCCCCNGSCDDKEENSASK
jgi:hypothetical protein